MTRIHVTAKAEDFMQYLRDMSELSETFKPLAEKLGGGVGITNGDNPTKHALAIFF